MATSCLAVDPMAYPVDVDGGATFVKTGVTPGRRVVLSHDPELLWYYPPDAPWASITIDVGPTLLGTWWKYISHPEPWDWTTRSIALSVVDIEGVDGGQRDTAREVLRKRLHDSMIETPVEDGVSHPAEDHLRTVVRTLPLEAAQWIRTLILADAASDIQPGILVCLGRLPRALTHPWGPEIAREALMSSSIELRHSAVRALELWGTEGAISILEAYREPEPWLADYVGRVVRDLKESRLEAALDVRAHRG